MFRKFLSGFFLVLILLVGPFVYGVIDDDAFKYSDFVQDENSRTNKISFEILDFSEFQSGDVFKMQTYLDKVLIDDSCEVVLDLDDSTLYKKFTCEVEKKKSGEYTFVATILRNGGELDRETVSFYVENVFKDVDILFNVLPDKTKVSIVVNVEGENLLVETRIPKEVIAILNDDNKDELIESDLDYIILEEDPLIAWEIAKAPTEINYTINKRISSEDIEKFDAQISQNKDNVKLFSYGLYVLIILIFLLVMMPVFKKIFKK